PPSISVLRAPDVNDCRTTCALSQRLVPDDPGAPSTSLASVNKMALPSGSTCGPSTISPGLTATISSGWPPFAETRMMPFSWPKTMPSRPQLPPKLVGVWQMVTATPPPTSIFLRVNVDGVVPDQKAMDRPSGEKKGPPSKPRVSVPERSLDGSSDIDGRYNCWFAA